MRMVAFNGNDSVPCRRIGGTRIGARHNALHQNHNRHYESKKFHRLQRYVQRFVNGISKIVTLLQDVVMNLQIDFAGLLLPVLLPHVDKAL